MSTKDPYDIDFEYKEYCLGMLEDWVNSALDCEEISSEEILNILTKSVKEHLNYHQDNAQKSESLYELLRKDTRKFNLLENRYMNSDEVSRNDPTRLGCDSDGWVYESPDKGNTVTKRKPGTTNKYPITRDEINNYYKNECPPGTIYFNGDCAEL